MAAPLVSWALDAAAGGGPRRGHRRHRRRRPDRRPAARGRPPGAQPAPRSRGSRRRCVAGLDAAEAAGHDAVVIGLADQPLVDRRGVATRRGRHRTPIAVATYDGQRRQPGAAGGVGVAAGPPELHGDEGARRLLAGARPGREVACPGDARRRRHREDLTDGTANEFTVDVPVDRGVGDAHRRRAHRPVPARRRSSRRSRATTYRGIVKVKVGPITRAVQGRGHLRRARRRSHRAVLKAEGRDTGGQGQRLGPHHRHARARRRRAPMSSVTTDLTITGKVAQFGRGVLADVSAKLIGQFVDRLEIDGAQPARRRRRGRRRGGRGRRRARPASTRPRWPPPADAAPTRGSCRVRRGQRRVDGSAPSRCARSRPEAEPVDLIGGGRRARAEAARPRSVVVLVLVLLVLRRRRR